MFYATKIKSVHSGGAIDVSGRSLRFIGYLPVKAGDTVYTDGKVIFGNAPPKGAPAIFDVPSSIPVLADNLRGYFTPQGKFKKYDVADDDWIANSIKIFKHGKNELNGQKIIDVEVNDNDDEYIATDGFYRTSKSVKYNNHIFYLHHSYYLYEVAPHNILYDVEPHVGEEITLGMDAPEIDIPVVVYKNGESIDEVNLKIYSDIATEEAIKARDEFMKISDDITIPTDLPQQPTPPANWIQKPPAPESFVAISYARIEDFRIDKDGNWDAVITAASQGYCFPHFILDGSVFEPTFSGVSSAFSNAKATAADNLEYAIFTRGYFPFLEIEKFHSFTGTKRSDGEYTPQYKKYIEEKIEYYKPIVRFKHYTWEPAVFHSYVQFQVHNGEIVDTRKRTGGAIEAYPDGISWDENIYKIIGSDWNRSTVESRIYYDIFSYESPLKKTPIGDNFFLCTEEGILYVYYGDQKLFEVTNEMLPKNVGDWISHGNYAFLFDTKYDNVAMDLADKGFGHFELLLIRDEIITTFRPTLWAAEQYLKVDDKQIYGTTSIDLSENTYDGFYRRKPFCVKLTHNRYLFGCHNNKLFKIENDGTYEEICDGLKNFRLREMKIISRTKR